MVEDDDDRYARFKAWLADPRVRLLRIKTGDVALRCVEDRFDLILLDHDLDKHHPQGRLAKIYGTAVVDRLIAARRNRMTPIVIHSMYLAARTQMEQRLLANGYDVELRPFADWTAEWARKLITDVVEEWQAEDE